MKTDSARFLTSAKNLRDCPRTSIPEIAFIGRSNVGKSSLVNMLTKQRDLAKVSKRPGKTRLINFFSMDGSWNLVDLPGYGFASGPKGERAQFNQAVGDYLSGRKGLTHIFVLIDSRSEPSEVDLEFISWVQERDADYSIIFTKTDEVSQDKWSRHIEIYTETMEALGLEVPTMIACSSKDRAGRGDLLQYIQKLLPKRKKKVKSGIQLGWMK